MADIAVEDGAASLAYVPAILRSPAATEAIPYIALCGAVWSSSCNCCL